MENFILLDFTSKRSLRISHYEAQFFLKIFGIFRARIGFCGNLEGVANEWSFQRAAPLRTRKMRRVFCAFFIQRTLRIHDKY